MSDDVERSDKALADRPVRWRWQTRVVYPEMEVIRNGIAAFALTPSEDTFASLTQSLSACKGIDCHLFAAMFADVVLSPREYSVPVIIGPIDGIDSAGTHFLARTVVASPTKKKHWESFREWVLKTLNSWCDRCAGSGVVAYSGSVESEDILLLMNEPTNFYGSEPHDPEKIIITGKEPNAEYSEPLANLLSRCKKSDRHQPGYLALAETQEERDAWIKWGKIYAAASSLRAHYVCPKCDGKKFVWHLEGVFSRRPS